MIVANNDKGAMFVCLGVFVPLEFFTHTDYGDVTIGDEELQILTYAWNLLFALPLSSEGSLACQIFCDTGHPFIMVICEDPWQSYQAFSNGAVTTYFYDLGLSQLGFEHPTFRLRGKLSNQLRHRRGKFACN